jgi:hypothetical protein
MFTFSPEYRFLDALPSAQEAVFIFMSHWMFKGRTAPRAEAQK